jgi:hypothetical protein
MGRQLDQITQIDRQIKTLALQQGEKDIDKVAAKNAELEKRKGSLLNEVLRAQAKIEAKKAGVGAKPTSLFGNSLDGRMLDAFATIGPKIENGTATEQERIIYSLSAQHYTRPTPVPIIDPVTKLITGYTEMRRPLPVLGGGSSTAQPGRTSMMPSISPLPSETGEVPAGAEVPPGAGVPPSAEVPPSQEQTREVSLWKDRNIISGPINAAKAAISPLPGLGAPFSDVSQARSQANKQAERLIDLLLKSEQGSVREQERLAKVIDLKPSAAVGGDGYGNNLISLGANLRNMITELEAQGRDDSGLAPADKARARVRVLELRAALKALDLPPVVRTYEESLLYPPGTEVLFNGKTVGKIPPR